MVIPGSRRHALTSALFHLYNIMLLLSWLLWKPLCPSEAKRVTKQEQEQQQTTTTTITTKNKQTKRHNIKQANKTPKTTTTKTWILCTCSIAQAPCRSTPLANWMANFVWTISLFLLSFYHACPLPGNTASVPKTICTLFRVVLILIASFLTLVCPNLLSFVFLTIACFAFDFCWRQPGFCPHSCHLYYLCGARHNLIK